MTFRPLDRLTSGLPPQVRALVDWVVTIAGALAVVLLVKAFLVNPYRIPSPSMEPTLHCARPAVGCEGGSSDRVLANRFLLRFREPRRGDVVVFETPPAARERCGAGGTFVKRIVGLPGERVSEQDGRIFIDGRALEEPYLNTARRDLNRGAWRVARGHYFMMGDNRVDSCDSRVWGAVPRGNLIGTVFATYWPPRRISIR